MQALAENTITMPVGEARLKVVEYLKSVRERHNSEDEAILRGYKALAQGRVVIDLPAVIKAGGVFERDGLPKLAVATASHKFVYVRRDAEGFVEFMPVAWRDLNGRRIRDVFPFPNGTLPERARDTAPAHPKRWDHRWNGQMRAMVPIVPPGLRPAHSLDGYVTLFEVDKWELDPKAPVDPALLKHIGGDLYAVVATWDLTDLERSVLAGRTR